MSKRRILDPDNLTNADRRYIRREVGLRSTPELVKLARESGLDLGKRKQTQISRAYKYYADFNNELVSAELNEKKRLIDFEKKQQQLLRKQEKQENKDVNNLALKISNLKPGDKIQADIKNNKFGAKLFKKIKGVRALMSNNDGVLTALNTNNIDRYIEIFDDEDYFIQEMLSEDSFVQAAQQMVNSGSVSFSGVASSNNITGSFFPYKHKLVGLDLTALQIYDESHKISVEDNSCFVQALISADVDEQKIFKIKQIIQRRELPQKLIKKIAEEHKLYITVRRIESGDNLRHYGDKTLPQIELGLIENHYFHIRKLPITSYAMKNYEQIKNENNWFNIKGIKKNGTYHKDTSKYISSYQIVKLLLEHKEDILTPISQEELYSSHYYNTKAPLTSIDVCDEFLKENKKPDDDLIAAKEYYKKKEAWKNIFFDYETTTQGKHKEYLCRASCFPNKVYLGEDCGRKMLYDLVNKYPDNNFRLIAHNAGYDLRFIMKHLCQVTLIERGKMLLRGNAKFYIRAGDYVDIQIQDSYALITSPLRDFGDMFNLSVEKEILPYNLYTEENVKNRFIHYSDCISACAIEFDNKNIGVKKNKTYYFRQKKFVEEYVDNINKWECAYFDKKKNWTVDIVKYSSIYCKMDCEVLDKGYNTFRQWILQVCELDIDDYVSLPSLANAYLLKQGVYDGVYSVSCVVREFIQKAMIGGRTMCSENRKHHTTCKVDDFDAVSLYPSAMKRLGGYLIGKPKLLSTTDFNLIKNYDGYFVEIEITKVNKHYKFPLMSIVNDNGIRVFTNEMIGNKIVVDKTTLEDLIHFQAIDFNIIRGYYYDEGRNYKLGKVIDYLFDQRLQAKKNKNPIQAVYKLLMNSAYGKTLLKPIEDETKYLFDSGKQEDEEFSSFDKYVSKHYNEIKEIIELPNGVEFKVKSYKSIEKHFNNCACGVEVLSMSKRIMNEVMCLAEDNNLNMYYQDTDSIHINTDDVSILADAYFKKYNRVLIGKQMGQFHTDFDSKVIDKNIHAKESIFLGKKCYIDVLTGDNGEIDYHIRMKGVSCESIKHYAHKNKLNLLDVYKELLNGKEIEFDLCCDGSKVSFEFKKNMEIHSRDKFKRNIKFV